MRCKIIEVCKPDAYSSPNNANKLAGLTGTFATQFSRPDGTVGGLMYMDMPVVLNSPKLISKVVFHSVKLEAISDE